MKEENQSIIYTCLAILRNLNHDEFSPTISKENNLDAILTELRHLEKTTEADKKLRNNIIEHLTNNMAGNFFNKIPVTEFEYEFEVLAQIVNTYIEELEGNTIHINNLQQLLIDLPVKFLVFSKDGFVLFQSRNTFSLVFSKINEIRLYDYIYDVFDKKITTKFNSFWLSKETKLTFEYTYKNPLNSTNLYYEIHLKKVHFSGQETVLMSIRNITQIKTEEIQSLTERIKGQDQERKRLAIDLHDSMGQELNAIKMYVQSLNNLKRNSSLYQEHFKELLTTIDQTIHSVREISFNLMPFILEKNSLIDACIQFFNKIQKQQLISVQTQIENSLHIFTEKSAQAFIYRIIQEFTNNSLKYSEASILTFEIQRMNQNTIRILLQDNGKGFDLNEIEHGNGIRNIKERLVILNAQYIFESTKQGTLLEFTLNG